MSCNDNNNVYRNSCCPDTPYPNVQHESVPSLIDNLVNALYGEITKTVSGGRVVWDIPCDPNSAAEILGIPRNDGEGLLCYFIRAFSSASGTYTGTFIGNLVGSVTAASNLLGAANTIPYQSALNTTSFLPFGSSGQVLGMLGSTLAFIPAPAAATAAAIIGGTAGSVLWQSGASATGFTGAGIVGQILTSAGAGSPTWQTNFAGNAASASILQTSRSITLAGDVAGTNTFDGSAAITITTAIQPNSVALGTDTTGNYVATIAAGTSGAESSTSGLTITATAGEATAAQLALANSGVAAGSYGGSSQTPVITVDARGRVTAASAVNTAPTTLIASANATGTAVDFLLIPSWVKRITVMLNGVSTDDANANVLIQLGAGSPFTTSGYNGYGMTFGTSGGNGAGFSTGFGILENTNAADVRSGLMTISNFAGNTWVAHGGSGNQATNTGFFSAGGVTLSGTLDRVRIVPSTGNFDAGSISISYEG